MTVEQAKEADVMAGDLYQHFKGGMYEVLAEAKHSETEEELIVYRSLETGKTWVRPKKMFFGKTDTGVPRFAKVGENGKLTTNDAWLERDVYPISKAGVEELQSCKCPYCKKYLTTPYMYYFTDYPYCPSCGKKIKDETSEVKTTPLNAVKAVIDGAGIPQSKVAKVTGLATQTVSNYYIGRTYPNLANFALICKACGVTVTIKDRRVHINAVN